MLAVVLAACPGLPGQAETLGRETLSVDLTGDSTDEAVSVFPLDADVDRLQIRDGATGQFLEVAVPASQSPDGPTLSLNDQVQLVVEWACFACGRYHTRNSLTVAYQNGSYFVVGFAHVQADRNYAQVTMCEVDLVAGQAQIGLIDYDLRIVPVTETAFPLADFKPDYRPNACAAMKVHDDTLLERLSKGSTSP